VPCHVPVAIVPTDASDERVATEELTRVPPPDGSAHVEGLGIEMVAEFPPENVILLPFNVIVLLPLFTPNPPYVPVMTEPCHVPPVMVPMEDSGNSADVRAHGPKVVADPQVPMT
jgi:hypothetical protein